MSDAFEVTPCVQHFTLGPAEFLHGHDLPPKYVPVELLEVPNATHLPHRPWTCLQWL